VDQVFLLLSLCGAEMMSKRTVHRRLNEEDDLGRMSDEQPLAVAERAAKIERTEQAAEPAPPESTDGTNRARAGQDGTEPGQNRADSGTIPGPTRDRVADATSILDHTVLDRRECLHPT
jgi:hypothetical protein